MKLSGYIYIAKGIQKKKKRSVPKLKGDDRINRESFGIAYTGFDFSRVVFTDECSIWLNETEICWQQKGEREPLECQSHPKKVHIWAAISVVGKVSFFVFTKNLNSKGYVEILKNRLLPYLPHLAAKLGHKPQDIVLQQDNSSVHNSSHVTNFLTSISLKSVDWPSRSPDLSPIENVWHLLKHAVRVRQPSTQRELKKIAEEEWNRLEDATISSLFQSIKTRIKLIVKNSGSPLNY